MATAGVLGFVGLGVMGEPMCRNLTTFPTRYILKDLSYAIQLAESAGVRLEHAATTRRLLEATAATGWSEAYFTAVIRTIEKR